VVKLHDSGITILPDRTPLYRDIAVDIVAAIAGLLLRIGEARDASKIRTPITTAAALAVEVSRLMTDRIRPQSLRIGLVQSGLNQRIIPLRPLVRRYSSNLIDGMLG